MRIRFALAAGAMAAGLVAVPARAASAGTVDGIGSLQLTANYFRTAGTVLGRVEIASSDSAGTQGVGPVHGNTIGYAAGGALTLGVVAAFVFGHNDSADLIANDPPSNPGSNNDTPDSVGDPENPGTPGNPATPNNPGTPGTPGDPGTPSTPDTPSGAQPDGPAGPTTVTPEPDALILFATGLSSLGAVSIRRRRRLLG